MESIEFNNINAIKEYPYSYKILNRRDNKHLFPETVFEKELVEYADQLDQRTEEQESPKVFLLHNGFVLLLRSYVYLLFPTLGDLENHLKAKEAGRKMEQKSTAYAYTKILDPARPRQREFLLPDGTAVPYLEYDEATYTAFLRDFTIAEQTTLTKPTVQQLTGTDGRVVWWLKREDFTHFRVFENLQTYQPWLNHASLKDYTIHAWQGRNPYQKTVLEHKEELLQKLADLLQLERSQIKYQKPGDDDIIHRAMKKLIFTDQLINELFLPLTIYLGEFQRTRYGGEWQLIKRQHSDYWIPVIFLAEKYFYLGRTILWDLLNPESEGFQPLTTTLWSPKSPRPNWDKEDDHPAEVWVPGT